MWMIIQSVEEPLEQQSSLGRAPHVVQRRGDELDQLVDANGVTVSTEPHFLEGVTAAGVVDAHAVEALITNTHRKIVSERWSMRL